MILRFLIVLIINIHNFLLFLPIILFINLKVVEIPRILFFSHHFTISLPLSIHFEEVLLVAISGSIVINLKKIFQWVLLPIG